MKLPEVTKRWWFWAGIGAALLGLIWVEPSVVTAPIYAAAYLTGIRGQRLTTCTTDTNGDVNETPEQLAAAAGALLGREVGVDAYALARNVHSEEGNASQDTQVAIAWVAANVADQRGVTVAELLTTCKRSSGQGKFGTQTGRWASTRSDPYEGDLEVAEAVLSGSIADPTGGAVHYFRPGLQDILFGQGKVSKTSDQIEASWGGDGFTVAGVDQGIEFFKAA